MAKTLENQSKATKGLIVTGVIAGASSLILLNKNAREKVIDTSKAMKGSVSDYATTIKENPQGTKDAIVNRIQNATEISKGAIDKIQNILDTEVKGMKETTQQVVEESKDMVSSAKQTKEELADVKEDAVLAKEELVSAKDDVKLKGKSENK